MAEKIVRQYRRCHCSTCHIHSVTCHSRCKDYLRWKAEEEEVKKAMREEREKLRTLSEAGQKYIWREKRLDRHNRNLKGIGSH